MSTRSQVIIKDEYGEQWFYRHSDGYPSGNMPQLFKFLKWVIEGRIRDNVEQSCGWLVLIGADEYGYEYDEELGKKTKDITRPSEDKFSGWKCGAYEPCPCKEVHGDIEWLYTIDLDEKTITVDNFEKKETYSFVELVPYDAKEKGWIKFDKKWGIEW